MTGSTVRHSTDPTWFKSISAAAPGSRGEMDGADFLRTPAVLTPIRPEPFPDRTDVQAHVATGAALGITMLGLAATTYLASLLPSPDNQLFVLGVVYFLFIGFSTALTGALHHETPETTP